MEQRRVRLLVVDAVGRFRAPYKRAEDFGRLYAVARSSNEAVLAMILGGIIGVKLV